MNFTYDIAFGSTGKWKRGDKAYASRSCAFKAAQIAMLGRQNAQFRIINLADECAAGNKIKQLSSEIHASMVHMVMNKPHELEGKIQDNLTMPELEELERLLKKVDW